MNHTVQIYVYMQSQQTVLYILILAYAHYNGLYSKDLYWHISNHNALYSTDKYWHISNHNELFSIDLYVLMHI